jgi:hypothetical protein
MIPKRTPPVFFRPGHDARPDGIQINIGQAVQQCIAILNDHALVPVIPQIPTPMPAFIEFPGKGLLEFLDEFRQGRPFLPPRLGLLFGK